MTSRTSSESSAYAAAGVDVDAQERVLAEVKAVCRSTYGPEVLSDLGSFAGLLEPDLEGFERPVLAASADGIGTKLVVAKMAGQFRSVGRDLVNHCTNDLLVQGARPLFFLDYLGTGALDPKASVDLIRGVADGCRENGCALLGGETAEMPGFYQPGDHELVGFIVGLVDRARILDGARVQHGDLLIGLPSAGLHTNGFSLARRVFFEKRGMGLDDCLPSGSTLRQVLLAPHLSYLRPLEGLLDLPGLHALAHVTGGGLTDNLPRVMPEGSGARVELGRWRVPEEFVCLEEWGGVARAEMLRVFNMGIGMVAVVAPEAASEVTSHLRGFGMAPAVIGAVESGERSVVYDRMGVPLSELAP